MWLKVGENRTHIGIISYSTDVRVDFSLGEHVKNSDLLSLIWGIDYMGDGRNTAEAIDEMRNMFNRLL